MPHDPAQQPDMSRLLAMTPAAPAGAPVSVSTNYPPSPNPFLRSPLPPMQQTSVDQLRQFYRVGSPQYRLLPLQPNAKAASNSAAQGIAITAANNVPASPTSVALTMPDIFNVAGSPGDDLVVTFKDEPPNLVFATPIAGLTGFEATGQGFSTGASTTVSAIPITATSWGFLFYEAGNFTATPSGWTRIGAVTHTYTNSFSGTGAVTVTQTISGPDQAGQVLDIFSGALPTLSQQNGVAGSTSGAIAFGGANTAGHTLMVVAQYSRGAAGGALGFSFSDTNGNSYDTIASQFVLGNQASFFPSIGNLAFVCSSCAAGANTINFAYLGTTGGDVVKTEIFEFTAFPAGPGQPFFRSVTNGDIASISVSKLNGIIPVSGGGTGANLTATGGASQVVQQTGTGAAFTVGQLAASNLSNGTTGTGAVVLASSPTVTTPQWAAFTVAGLPAGSTGQYAYATDGRKVGEGPGAGTGVPVYFSTAQWRVFSTDAQVLA